MRMTEPSYKYEDENPQDSFLQLKQSLQHFTTAVSKDASQLRSYHEYGIDDGTQEYGNGKYSIPTMVKDSIICDVGYNCL